MVTIRQLSDHKNYFNELDAKVRKYLRNINDSITN